MVAGDEPEGGLMAAGKPPFRPRAVIVLLALVGCVAPADVVISDPVGAAEAAPKSPRGQPWSRDGLAVMNCLVRAKQTNVRDPDGPNKSSVHGTLSSADKTYRFNVFAFGP